MLYLAYISLLFVAMQFFNALINFLFRQNIISSSFYYKGLVSVLIPARNEAENIADLLSDLQNVNAPNLEIIVFNDESSDQTAQVVQSFVNKDKRIRLIDSPGLPEGWLGKNYACSQLAKEASGNYLLFLDADVRIEGCLIEDAVMYCKRHNLKLLSCFPTQIQNTFGELISVPVMNYILLTLLPLIFVRKSPFISHAAANGQFMLFKTDTYRHINPHLLFKNEVVEDIVIARYFKKKKIRIACVTGESRLRCRMYSSYNEALSGFSKNIFMFFGNYSSLAMLFWLFSTFGFLPVIFELPQFICGYFGLFIGSLLLYSSLSRQNLMYSIFLFPLQLIFLLQVMGNTILQRKNNTMEWKKRNIYS